MFIPEPAPWPEQVKLPAPLVRHGTAEEKRLGPAALITLFCRRPAGLRRCWDMSGPCCAFAAPGQGRARQGHRRQAKVPTILAWIAAVISFFLILGFGGKFLPPFAAMLAAPGLATGGQLLTGQNAPPPPGLIPASLPRCGQPMDMVADSEDDKFLTTEEAAEEKAGGMDYEFWRCPNAAPTRRWPSNWARPPNARNASAAPSPPAPPPWWRQPRSRAARLVSRKPASIPSAATARPGSTIRRVYPPRHHPHRGLRALPRARSAAAAPAAAGPAKHW